MIEHLDPSTREEFQRIADEIYLKGEAKSEADAMVTAIQRNPDLFSGGKEPAADEDADGKPVKTSDFEAKAKALVTAGDAKDIDEAFGIVAATDPTAYSAYLKTLG